MSERKECVKQWEDRMKVVFSDSKMAGVMST